MLHRHALSLSIGVGLTSACLLFVEPLAAADHDPWPSTKVGEPTPKVEGMPPELAKRLANFDDLDFRVYTGQQWEDLHKSHAKDITVHYPDGHTTKGIPDHIKELEFMWTFAPDNRITEHPVRFGTADAEWTAVMGFLDGTFTKPMTLADGTVIQPTGKTYHLPMATLGRWNKILWGVDSGLHRGRVSSLENLSGGQSCLRQPINPRHLPLSASILAQSSSHWN